MTTALFATPIEGELIHSGMPCLIVGVNNDDHVLVVNDEGHLEIWGMNNVRINWRHNWTDHCWVDVGEVDDNDPQDDPTDGGQDLSGLVPGPDGPGAGDPLDPEGQSTPGDPGGLDTGEAR